MFYVPMVFMLIVTITSLAQTIIAKFKVIADPAGADKGWMVVQAAIGALLIVLALIIAVDAFKTLAGGKKSDKKAEAK